MISPAPDLAILKNLAGCTYATAAEISRDCKLGSATALAHLMVLETMSLVSSRQDPDSKPPRRVYVITSEGRRRAEG